MSGKRTPAARSPTPRSSKRPVTSGPAPASGAGFLLPRGFIRAAQLACPRKGELHFTPIGQRSPPPYQLAHVLPDTLDEVGGEPIRYLTFLRLEQPGQGSDRRARGRV